MSMHKVVVTTIVEIDGQPVMFTVAGQTERNQYRLARRLSETNNGDVYDWAVDESWKARDSSLRAESGTPA